jgi:hypothetical protein
MLRARTLRQLLEAIRPRRHTAHTATAEQSLELPEELLEQARTAVLARIDEFGQGPLLIRRSRD